MNLIPSTAAGAVTRLVNRAGLQVAKHAPEILTGLGIAGGIATVVLASRATLKLKENIAFGQQLRDSFVEKRNTETVEEYSQAQYAGEMIGAYLHIARGVVKTYAVSAGVGAASVSCVLGAIGIMRQRNAALTAAYNVLDAAHRSYRERVAKELGTEREQEIAFAVENPEEVTDADKAKLEKDDLEKLAKRLQEKNDANRPSPYSAFITNKNVHWTRDTDDMLFNLKVVQNNLNDKLRIQGHLFLNEAYDALGVPRTKAGQVVGWVYDTSEGDQFVDFGLERVEKQISPAFGNTLSDGFWVELNVDGVIYDKI